MVELLLGGFLMDGAVNFDDETSVVAEEVGDESADRVLTSKFEPS